MAPSDSLMPYHQYGIIPPEEYRKDTNIGRIVSGKPVVEDSTIETSLRPRQMAEFIGQNKVKDNLLIAIAAAKKRGEALDHMLLYGRRD